MIVRVQPISKEFEFTQVRHTLAVRLVIGRLSFPEPEGEYFHLYCLDMCWLILRTIQTMNSTYLVDVFAPLRYQSSAEHMSPKAGYRLSNFLYFKLFPRSRGAYSQQKCGHKVL